MPPFYAEMKTKNARTKYPKLFHVMLFDPKLRRLPLLEDLIYCPSLAYKTLYCTLPALIKWEAH